MDLGVQFQNYCTQPIEDAATALQYAERHEAVNYVPEPWPRDAVVVGECRFHGSDGGAEGDDGRPSSSPRRRHLATPVGAAAEGWASLYREVSTDVHLTSASVAAATASDTLARD